MTITFDARDPLPRRTALEVLEGEVTVQLGDDLVRATAGTLICKPRRLRHTFWNETSTPARLLEIISPAGLERYFEELAPLVASGPPDLSRIVALGQKYGLDVDMEAVGDIVSKHGVRLEPRP